MMQDDSECPLADYHVAERELGRLYKEYVKTAKAIDGYVEAGNEYPGVFDQHAKACSIAHANFQYFLSYFKSAFAKEIAEAEEEEDLGEYD